MYIVLIRILFALTGFSSAAARCHQILAVVEHVTCAFVFSGCVISCTDCTEYTATMAECSVNGVELRRRWLTDCRVLDITWMCESEYGLSLARWLLDLDKLLMATRLCYQGIKLVILWIIHSNINFLRLHPINEMLTIDLGIWLVCLSCGRAVQKWLNGSTSCLGTQETLLACFSDFSCRCRILWPRVSYLVALCTFCII